MKVWVTYTITFLLGFLLAAFLGLSLYVETIKTGIISEIHAYSLALELSPNHIEELNQISCMALDIGLKNYTEINSSLFSFHYHPDIEKLNSTFWTKVKNQIGNNKVCKNT